MDFAFIQEILKTSGIAGVLVIAFIKILNKVIADNKETINCLLANNKEIGIKSNESFNANTAALHELSQTHLSVANTMENISAGIDRHSEQNRQEHGEILNFIRRLDP